MLDLSSNYTILLKLFMLLILIICVLINVAFLTLLERNLLGYIQIRKGPNKVSLMGILQPVSDAIKLFTKENIYPIASNFMFYYICPVLSLLLSLLIWVIYPWGGGLLNLNLGTLLMISIMSLNVYPILGCGWFSNSKYALLGCLRSIAQAISYEVSLVISLICVIVMSFGFNFSNVTLYQGKVWFIFMMSFLGMLWMVSMLAETNRTPFDFAEGESELVSGYNIEYSGGGFALIFMSEYSSILFMSMLYSLLFFGGYDMLLFVKIIFFSFLFIFIRGLLPRFRYDKLMYVAWKTLLPLSLFMLFMSVNYMFIM